MVRLLALASLCLLALVGAAGCGGGGLSVGEPGAIMGTITDLDGNPVRGARVICEDRNQSVRTNASGLYTLSVREGVWYVRASIEVNGITYVGQTVAQVFEAEPTKSVNITLTRQSTAASITGVVRDRSGRVVEGARVFAYLQDPNSFILSSVMDISNANGEYDLKDLAPGYTYVIHGSARGFGGDRDQVVLTPSELRQYDISLNDPQDPLFAPPANLSAVAWTTPDEPALRGSLGGGLAAVKQRIRQRLNDPKKDEQAAQRPVAQRTLQGNYVEVDLYWDKPASNLAQLLGYGIYRATSQNGNSTAVDFLRDPETTFFMDLDEALRENTNYYYEITALNVRYPNTGNSESDFSNRYGVRTLGDMNTLEPLQGPLQFRWIQTSSATGYYIFLFDEFPDFGVQEIWSTPNPVTGVSAFYNGPSLISGRRYYYVILAVANNDDSRSLSQIQSFVAN